MTAELQKHRAEFSTEEQVVIDKAAKIVRLLYVITAIFIVMSFSFPDQAEFLFLPIFEWVVVFLLLNFMAVVTGAYPFYQSIHHCGIFD